MREIGKLLSTLLGSGIVRPSTQVPWLKGRPGTSMSGVGAVSSISRPRRVSSCRPF